MKETIMLNLNDREWGEFCLTSIFNINSSNSEIDKAKLRHEEGVFPYITRTKENNGISAFVCEQPSYNHNKENCIVVGLDTQTVFYQNASFYTGQNIQILRSDKLNEHIAQFLIPLLHNTLDGLYWGGNGATLARLKRSKIMLPVTSSGSPDYAFMELYTKEREQQIMKKYIDYIGKNAQIYGDITPLNEKEWRTFSINELFTLIPGKGKGANHLKSEQNGISYLGATNRNNGVIDYVQPAPQMVQTGNCIAFIRNGEGSMGYAVYKREDFIATSDITVGYADFLNRYTGIFVTTVADKVRGKYKFNYKRSDTRLKKELLQLPVDDSGTPDWEYMEQYMRYCERQIIQKYIEYIKNTEKGKS